MSDTPEKPIRSYNDILRARPSGDELGRAILEAMGASDRASALLFTSHVDTLLLSLITNELPRDEDEVMDELTSQGASLSTFSNKITLAYALGIISGKTRRELNVIRKIRNAFAHSVLSLDFSEPAIKQMCMALDVDRMHHYLNDGASNVSVSDSYKIYSPEKRNFCVVSLGYTFKFQEKVISNMRKENSNLRSALDFLKRNNIPPDQIGEDYGL
jgi:hypothetical protein